MADVTARVRRIQEVMHDLMIENTHYGKIPGTPKPTLYQPGAEMLCMTFRIAPSPRVEELSTSDAIRYRITMQGTNQTTGEMLGEGIGECSSDEEKYRWRKPVCVEEWNETPVDLRREKWVRGNPSQGNYKVKQIRTSPADLANTILKMAYKRALISMTRTVLGCSDIFAQDLDDLTPEIRDLVVEGQNGHAQPEPPAPQPMPQRKAPTPPPTHSPRTSTPPSTPPPMREPGDEMDEPEPPEDPFGDFNTPPLQEDEAEASVRSGKFAKGGAVISEQQRKRMFAIAMQHGWDKESYREKIQKFGFNRDNDVTTLAYEVICQQLELGRR